MGRAVVQRETVDDLVRVVKSRVYLATGKRTGQTGSGEFAMVTNEGCQATLSSGGCAYLIAGDVLSGKSGRLFRSDALGSVAVDDGSGRPLELRLMEEFERILGPGVLMLVSERVEIRRAGGR